MLPIALQFAVAKIAAAPKVVKIIGGAYLTGALVSGIKALVDGESLATSSKSAAMSWGGLFYAPKKVRTSKKSGTKTVVAKMRSARTIMKKFQQDLDAAVEANDRAKILSVTEAMYEELKKLRAPKSLLREMEEGIKDLKAELTPAPAPQS